MTKLAPVQTPTKQPTKAEIVEKLLRAARGASLDEIVKATGWQPHSCRAFLTGLRKSGKQIESEKMDSVRRYRIVKAKK